MSITRTTVTDDSGSGTDGTIGNNAWLQALFDTLDARWSRFSYSSTGGQNNVDVDEADLVLLTSASTSTLTGLQAPASPAKPGKVTLFKNTTANVFLFSHNSGSSSAGNRFFNAVTSAPTPVAEGGWIAYVYDDANSRWALIGHEQGAWITPTFSAGDFTAQAGSWTVDGADAQSMAYRLSGRTLSVAVQIENTDVSATPSYLQIANGQFGGFTVARSTVHFGLVNDAGAGYVNGVMQVLASAIRFFKAGFGTANYTTTSSDNTDVAGSATFDVT